MKEYRFTILVLLLLLYYSNCFSQTGRKEMISYYKEVFLYKCIQPFEMDTVFRDEVCTHNIDWIDKRSFLEIDSMSKLVGEEIRLDVEIINKDSSGDFLPSKVCVLHYCLDKYESEELDKLAKSFAKRMKNVKIMDLYKY